MIFMIYYRVDQILQCIKILSNFIEWSSLCLVLWIKNLVWNLWYGPAQHRIFGLGGRRVPHAVSRDGQCRRHGPVRRRQGGQSLAALHR